jgi:hypothetical protein
VTRFFKKLTSREFLEEAIPSLIGVGMVAMMLVMVLWFSWYMKPSIETLTTQPPVLNSQQLQLIQDYRSKPEPAADIDGRYSGKGSLHGLSADMTYTFKNGVLTKHAVVMLGFAGPSESVIEGSAPYRMEGSVIMLDGPVTGAESLFSHEGEAISAVKPGVISLPNQSWTDLKRASVIE